MSFDAGGNQEAPAVRSCPQCGAGLRTGGPGRPPRFCCRSCSSKAYRRRRAKAQEQALLDARDSARVDIPQGLEGPRADLLRLGGALERIARRYVQALEEAQAAGHGPDTGGALDYLQQRLLPDVAAQFLKVADDARRELLDHQGDAGPAPLAQQGAAPSTGPHRAAGQPFVSSRVETFPQAPADARPGAGTPSTATPQGDARPDGRPSPVSARVEIPAPGPASDGSAVSTREETGQPNPAPPRPRESASQLSGAPRLALSAQPTVALPAGWGQTTFSHSLAARLGADWQLAGWSHDRVVYVVRQENHDRGWVQNGADGLPGWAAVVAGRIVVDAADGEPLLSTRPEDAATLIKLALDQGLI